MTCLHVTIALLSQGGRQVIKFWVGSIEIYFSDFDFRKIGEESRN